MLRIGKFILKMLGWLLMLPVYFYKFAISPFTPASCRHEPTCSQYAIDAIKIHGPFKGFWLGARRISKCHPWGTHGYDPVPPKKASPIPNPSPDSTGSSTEGRESGLDDSEQIA